MIAYQNCKEETCKQQSGIIQDAQNLAKHSK